MAARLHARIGTLERRGARDTGDDLDDLALLTQVRAIFAANPDVPWRTMLEKSGFGHCVQGLVAEAGCHPAHGGFVPHPVGPGRDSGGGVGQGGDLGALLAVGGGPVAMEIGL